MLYAEKTSMGTFVIDLIPTQAEHKLVKYNALLIHVGLRIHPPKQA